MEYVEEQKCSMKCGGAVLVPHRKILKFDFHVTMLKKIIANKQVFCRIIACSTQSKVTNHWRSPMRKKLLFFFLTKSRKSPT